jgi:RNA polymerase sigma-70 factor (ECF subfamily)
MTSAIASPTVAAHPRDLIAAPAVRYKILEVQSVWSRSRWWTLALDKEEPCDRFETLDLPHLDSAHNFARLVPRDEQDAKDVVQEALLRAFRFFDQFRGMNARAWLLKLVRHALFTSFVQKRAKGAVSLDYGDEDQTKIQGAAATSSHALGTISAGPEELTLARVDRQVMNAAIERLPVKFKEAPLLREFEDLSYKEIAMVTVVPVGTVMSRVARARGLLTKGLQQEFREGVSK